jgi:hypothetical protein
MATHDLELDISDGELAEIMPRISPTHTMTPANLIPSIVSSTATGPSSTISTITAAIVSEPVALVTKKPRKPRVSKKAHAMDTSGSVIPVTTDEPSTDSPSTASPNKKSPSAKSTKKDTAIGEQQFTLGLTKECFTTEELAINPLTQIFIENSRVTNNELIKYQAVRTGILDYKCYGKGCPTKDGNWRRRIGFLMLVRNNNRDTDLRMTNLSLLCPNCYCQEKGVIAFDKVKKEIVRTCTFCCTVLDTKYNSDKCGRCTWQIKNQIHKSTNMDRLSRAFGSEVDGLSASNMALLMNSSILDEGTTGVLGGGFSRLPGDTHKYSGSSVSAGGSRYQARQTVNPTMLRIENSISLKRLFMELSEQM